MVSQVKQLFRYRSLLTNKQPDNLEVRVISDPKSLLAARQLHARRYLRWGYIQESDIASNGTMNRHADPYAGHSIYFAVFDKSKAGTPLVAVSRQIKLRPGSKSHHDLPTLANVPLGKEAIEEIERYTLGECVEISALVKDSGVSSLAPLMLYRAMWHYSLMNGHKLWLMGVDRSVYRLLDAVFDKSIERIGGEAFYMGSLVIPASVRIGNTVDNIIHDLTSKNFTALLWQRDLALFLCDGLPKQVLSPGQMKLLEKSGQHGKQALEGLAYE